MKIILTLCTVLILLARGASAAEPIFTTLKEAGTFKMLIAALEAAGKDTLMKTGTGPYTVFAPSDAAFGKLPKGMFENLLLPENKDKLGKILDYHVVPLTLPSADLRSTRLKTANATEVQVRVQGPLISVDNAKVTQADVEASNGVIHVIDTVLMPK